MMYQAEDRLDYDARSDVDPVFDIPLERYSEHLKHLVRKAALAENGGCIQDYFHNLLDLESAILSDFVNDREAARIMCGEGVREAVETSQRLFSAFELALEDSLTDAYRCMSHRRDFLSVSRNVAYNYMVRYRNLATREIRLGEIGKEDKVALVGAGPFPVTAMEYARQANCQIDGLEVRTDAAWAATSVVEDLGFADRVRINLRDGQTFDYSGYSVVHVGVLAEPKSKIFDQIARTADPSARILCRTTHGLRQMIYRPTDFDQVSRFRPVRTDAATGFQTLSTVLLQRLEVM